MNKNDIQETLIKLQGETASLSDPNTKDIFKSLFNLIDQLYSENEALREENQQLKDEINGLKGNGVRNNSSVPSRHQRRRKEKVYRA